MLRILCYLSISTFFLASCSNSNSGPNSNSNSNAKAPEKESTVSQFERAGYCDFLIDKSGVYHALFQESPANGKSIFIYYASSTDQGATWSKPIALSDDHTANGSSYGRILQDGSGNIYAIWKRFGQGGNQYPVQEVTLDGPGSYSIGTLYYKVLNNGNWSDAVQLNEFEAAQQSWFATVTPQGKVQVFWTQFSPQALKATQQTMWYYCDYFRMTELNGTNHTAFTDLNSPSTLTQGASYPSEQNGAINLDGYVDNTGTVHLIYEDKPNGIEEIKYFDGKTKRVVYSYPKGLEDNTFNHPAKLMKDEKGNDHLLFLPSPKTLESEQVWDMNLSTNQTNVLVSIQKPTVTISGFQANQGPNGSMAITFEAGAYAENTEAYGIFYNNGAWQNVGLTNNASKEKFFSREFEVLGGYHAILSTITRYNSTFGAVAWDGAGNKSMLMNISAYWSGAGISTSSPSIVFIPIGK